MPVLGASWIQPETHHGGNTRAAWGPNDGSPAEPLPQEAMSELSSNYPLESERGTLSLSQGTELAGYSKRAFMEVAREVLGDGVRLPLKSWLARSKTAVAPDRGRQHLSDHVESARAITAHASSMYSPGVRWFTRITRFPSA